MAFAPENSTKMSTFFDGWRKNKLKALYVVQSSFRQYNFQITFNFRKLIKQTLIYNKQKNTIVCQTVVIKKKA